MKLEEKSLMELLCEIFNNMIGKKVSLIDSTNYLLRVSGSFSVRNDNMIEIKKGNDRVIILIESIVSYKELKSDGKTKNLRFTLHNNHNFDLVY
jgi:RNase P/RNase MRP subunit p29